MATKKKTTKKPASSSSARSGGRKQPVNPPEPAPPIRRELGGILFFFLAVFTGVSFFSSEGAFVRDFSDTLKGFVGWGYWICVPAFLVVSYILFFHRGRPVSLRIFCCLVLPVLLSALVSLIVYQYDMTGSDVKELTKLLFDQGKELDSGGVLGGLLAVGLEMAFSIYGAFPVLIVLLGLCMFCVFRSGFKKAADKVKYQVQTPYDPARYENTLTPIDAVSGALAARQSVRKIERVQRSASSMDIPLGESDDDALSLFQTAGEPPVLPPAEPKPVKKTKVSVVKEPAKENATDGVKPVSAEEAARMAGIDLKAYDEAKADRNVPDKASGRKGKGKSAAVPAENAVLQKEQRMSRDEVNAEAQAVAEAVSAAEEKPDYVFPPIALLKSGTSAAGDAREEILLNKERLEGAIRSFGIGASIVGVTRGPTVTRYDIELEQGVKLARVTNLAGDLALSLGVVNVRIAPIPDKISTVGIEVPNKIVSTVSLRDIIESPKFTTAKSKLSFALGKDIGGECIVGNIAKLPHMLIAGTTGSGKSVCMNSLILSLLYKARPDEVKLIMIDPKMVELGVYNGIPHLYVPVVTDPKKAAGALQWSVVEMLKRYRLFSEIGVRDIDAYNRHCQSSGETTLPRVVIVIDELADLMMIASKDVEESICRVAQMGRAAGMHLIIATQRPSADVITGLMKANIPSRIAFAVSSTLESRIILDQGGAEKLIGMGDMLFSPVGVGKPIRIQGAYVSDEEREEVIQFIKEGAGETQKNNEIEEYMNKAAEDKNSDGPSSDKEDKALGGYDEMLPQAVEVVLETKSCSVSMLQRRIKLGYSRAARIVDQMEELGIVGPYEGAKPRSVVVDRDGWTEIQRRLGLIDDSDMSLAAQMNEDGSENDYDN